MEDTRYFSRSWALLTRDKGWVKPMLVMMVAELVPIAGMLGNKGYALEYARLTAWGVDAAPKQKDVNVTQCIKSGWRGFVVDLGWGFVLSLAFSLFAIVTSALPGRFGQFLGLLVSFALMFVSIATNVMLNIAELRSSIYEKIGAGYRIDRIVELIQRDTRGFGKLLLIMLACTLVLTVIGVIVATIMIICFAPVFYGLAQTHTSEYQMIMSVSQSMVTFVPVVMVFGLVFSFLGNIVRVLLMNTVGLWMRQFNVPSWGKSEDPLPN